MPAETRGETAWFQLLKLKRNKCNLKRVETRVIS